MFGRARRTAGATVELKEARYHLFGALACAGWRKAAEEIAPLTDWAVTAAITLINERPCRIAPLLPLPLDHSLDLCIPTVPGLDDLYYPNLYYPTEPNHAKMSILLRGAHY